MHIARMMNYNVLCGFAHNHNAHLLCLNFTVWHTAVQQLWLPHSWCATLKICYVMSQDCCKTSVLTTRVAVGAVRLLHRAQACRTAQQPLTVFGVTSPLGKIFVMSLVYNYEAISQHSLFFYSHPVIETKVCHPSQLFWFLLVKTSWAISNLSFSSFPNQIFNILYFFLFLQQPSQILTVFNFIKFFIAQAKQHITQEWNSNNTINQSRAVTKKAVLLKLSFYEAVDWWVINEMTWNFTDRLS